MVESLITDLRRHSTWDPSSLLVASFRWPTTHPLVRLGEVTTAISPEAVVNAGSEVITPASIDPSRGGVRRRSRRYQGSAYLVGGSLQQGDLLVSTSPETPAVLVDEHVRAAVVSSRFVALRPLPDIDPLWLWGALNSESGQRIRRAAALRSATPLLRAHDIEALEIPLANPDAQAELKRQLQEVHSTTVMEEEEQPATWWHVADLRGRDWHFETMVSDPEMFRRGVPLADLCSEITRGKTSVKDAHTKPKAGDLPVTDIQVLNGNPSKVWVSPGFRVTIAHPGDVLVPSVGERSHAMLCTEPTAVHQNVFVLRLHDASVGPALVNFFRSTEGYRLRHVLLTPSVIPRINKKNLGRIPIPPTALEPREAVMPPTQPLAHRLERVLWAH